MGFHTFMLTSTNKDITIRITSLRQQSHCMKVITNWQRDFQVMIGKNNAKYFDEQGWLYFTKEVFDLYYPSYGDSYPTFNGAIGMTYEQAGGGFGGLSITTETGDPLTLKDRLTHQYTAGISTVEVTSQNAARVVDEFEKYF